MGAGHDTVARELARRARDQGHQVQVLDVLRLLPPGIGSTLRAFYQSTVRHFPWAYAVLYRAFLRPGPGRRPSGTPLARLAAGQLTRAARRMRAEVVVPVFHLAAQLTGHLRERDRLPCPSAVLLVDFAVHRQWLHPGNDVYLCLTGRRRVGDKSWCRRTGSGDRSRRGARLLRVGRRYRVLALPLRRPCPRTPAGPALGRRLGRRSGDGGYGADTDRLRLPAGCPVRPERAPAASDGPRARRARARLGL
ncbi:hypothetical protein ACFXDO_36130 [Streptomyces nigra]|uniref:MGDG synthase family glycosyltransferase n=1 Tax=Streptomyces nigra TaxID=1827580 RepID=UPI0036B17F62